MWCEEQQGLFMEEVGVTIYIRTHAAYTTVMYLFQPKLWSICTHRGRTGAAQVVYRLQAGQRTLGRGALLCRVLRCVEGLPQDVVHAAVGPVVVSRGDLQHVCTTRQVFIFVKTDGMQLIKRVSAESTFKINLHDRPIETCIHHSWCLLCFTFWHL